MVETSPSNAGDACPTSDQGAKIPHALQPINQNIKQKQYCSKFNKSFKNGPHQKNQNKQKNSSPKTIEEFGSFEHELPVLLAWCPATNLSPFQTLTFWIVWPHCASGT